jgi:hypothetical protein
MRRARPGGRPSPLATRRTPGSAPRFARPSAPSSGSRWTAGRDHHHRPGPRHHWTSVIDVAQFPRPCGDPPHLPAVESAAMSSSAHASPATDWRPSLLARLLQTCVLAARRLPQPRPVLRAHRVRRERLGEVLLGRRRVARRSAMYVANPATWVRATDTYGQHFLDLAAPHFLVPFLLVGHLGFSASLIVWAPRRRSARGSRTGSSPRSSARPRTVSSSTRSRSCCCPTCWAR